MKILCFLRCKWGCYVLMFKRRKPILHSLFKSPMWRCYCRRVKHNLLVGNFKQLAAVSILLEQKGEQPKMSATWETTWSGSSLTPNRGDQPPIKGTVNNCWCHIMPLFSKWCLMHVLHHTTHQRCCVPLYVLQHWNAVHKDTLGRHHADNTWFRVKIAKVLQRKDFVQAVLCYPCVKEAF